MMSNATSWQPLSQRSQPPIIQDPLPRYRRFNEHGSVFITDKITKRLPAMPFSAPPAFQRH
jgi:hypothetical protein